MSNLPILDQAQAVPASKTLLDGVQCNMGATPNMLKAMAHSPAALGSYLAFAGGLG